jgi:hypothetical protein
VEDALAEFGEAEDAPEVGGLVGAVEHAFCHWKSAAEIKGGRECSWRVHADRKKTVDLNKALFSVARSTSSLLPLGDQLVWESHHFDDSGTGKEAKERRRHDSPVPAAEVQCLEESRGVFFCVGQRM